MRPEKAEAVAGGVSWESMEQLPMEIPSGPVVRRPLLHPSCQDFCGMGFVRLSYTLRSTKEF